MRKAYVITRLRAGSLVITIKEYHDLWYLHDTSFYFIPSLSSFSLIACLTYSLIVTFEALAASLSRSFVPFSKIKLIRSLFSLIQVCCRVFLFLVSIAIFSLPSVFIGVFTIILQFFHARRHSAHCTIAYCAICLKFTNRSKKQKLLLT